MKARMDLIPSGAYREQLTVRSYEVGRRGTVRPATLLRYLENLATGASSAAGFAPDWYVVQGTAWVVRNMDILFGLPPRYGDQLGMATWVAEFRRVQALREYAIWNITTGALVARASARWAYVDRYQAIPVRLPEAMTFGFATFGAAMVKRSLPPLAADVRTAPTTFELVAREYEVDSQQHVNNCAYVDWLWEAALQAAGEFGLSDATMARPRYYALEYVRPTPPGERVEVRTYTAVPTGASTSRLPARMDQEIRHTSTGAVCLRASTAYLPALFGQSQ